MPMSEDERRRLLELEAELAGERRLVRLARQLGAANVYTGMRRITAVWIAGGAIGLSLVIAGAAAHAAAVIAAGLGTLVATLLLVGVAAIVVEVRGFRRERREEYHRDPHPPGR